MMPSIPSPVSSVVQSPDQGGPSIGVDPMAYSPAKWSEEFFLSMYNCTPTQAALKSEGQREQYEAFWKLREIVEQLTPYVSVHEESGVFPEPFVALKRELAGNLRLIRLVDQHGRDNWAAARQFRANPLLANPSEERRWKMSTTSAQKASQQRFFGTWVSSFCIFFGL